MIDLEAWKHALSIEKVESESIQKFHRMWIKAQARRKRIFEQAFKCSEGAQ